MSLNTNPVNLTCVEKKADCGLKHFSAVKIKETPKLIKWKCTYPMWYGECGRTWWTEKPQIPKSPKSR